MKVIFLDADGVINYATSGPFDPTCLENLSKITKATGAKIVLISSWRMAYNENGTVRHKWAAHFEHNLQLFGMELYALAPYLNDRRSAEVDKYLKENDVSHYVIIDDSDYNYSQKHPKNWVQPDAMHSGLTEELAEKCINILT
ncbi:MAG: HAD domain-containing protein [Clostridia bacterium]